MKSLPYDSDYFQKFHLAMGIMAQFPLGSFYSVTVDDYSIKLQGGGNLKCFEICDKLKFKHYPGPQYLRFQWSIVMIVFSDYDPDYLLLTSPV